MDNKDWAKLMPKDKYDIVSVNTLGKLDDNTFELLLPDLFMWISDINWPVASPIIELLSERPHKIVTSIKKHLGSTEIDDDLKYNILLYLIPKLPFDVQKDLVVDIQRIYCTPTDIEQAGAWEAASIFMDQYKRFIL